MSTLERKKKNFSFTRKFPFMKSRDNIDDASEGERKYTKYLITKQITCTIKKFCSIKKLANE